MARNEFKINIKDGYGIETEVYVTNGTKRITIVIEKGNTYKMVSLNTEEALQLIQAIDVGIYNVMRELHATNPTAARY